jgi:hypothetical protein
VTSVTFEAPSASATIALAALSSAESSEWPDLHEHTTNKPKAMVMVYGVNLIMEVCEDGLYLQK